MIFKTPVRFVSRELDLRRRIFRNVAKLVYFHFHLIVQSNQVS